MIVDWRRLDNGVWVGPRVATDIELRWYGADGFIAIERIAWEFWENFPRYLGNYDPDRDGLTADAWWLTRVQRLRDASATPTDPVDVTCPAHGEHPHLDYGGVCLDCEHCDREKYAMGIVEHPEWTP